MLRKDLAKTQIYLFILAGLIIISKIIEANVVSPFLFEVSPGEIITEYIFGWILMALVPLVWALVLYKIPKKFNVISLIFPLIVLVFVCGQLASNLAQGMFLIEAFYFMLFVSSIPLIFSLIGMFLIINETFEFSNQRKARVLIILGIIIFMVIVSALYFNGYGGKLSNIYFDRESMKQDTLEIDPLSIPGSESAVAVYLVFNSSGISTKYINGKNDSGCFDYTFVSEFLSSLNINNQLCCVDYGVRPDFRICKSNDGKYQNLWYVSYNKTFILSTEAIFEDNKTCFYDIPTDKSILGGRICR